MTQIDTWGMTGNIDSFRRGATAFRNARDLAQGHRDQFIQAANIRSSQPRPETPPEAEITVAEIQQHEESTCEELVNCEDYARPQVIGTENYAASQDVNEEPAPPQYLYTEDEEPSQESAPLDAVEPAMSLAASSTSSFSTPSQTRPKRNRAPRSPPSNPRPHKKQGFKSGTRYSTSQRLVGSSTRASTSKQPAAVEKLLDLE
jgi:hypothetical protein